MMRPYDTRIDYPLPEGWELHFYPLLNWGDNGWETIGDKGDFVLRDKRPGHCYDILLQPTPHDEGLFEQIRSYCGLA